MRDNREGQGHGNEQPPERQSIWSIPGHLGRWYGGIFAGQYLFFLGLTIWDELVYQTGDNSVQTVLAVQRGMTGNILNIAASTYVILEGVMLAHWLKERDQRKEREAVERAERVQRQWQSWYERMQTAQWLGLPFDEPPPTGPQNKNGK